MQKAKSSEGTSSDLDFAAATTSVPDLPVSSSSRSHDSSIPVTGVSQSRWSLSLEDEWEERHKSVKSMKEIKKELSALKDGEGNIRASVTNIDSLQREVAAIGLVEQKVAAAHE